MITKTLASGEMGSAVVTQENGECKLAVNLQGSLGGGKAAGVLKGKVSAEIDVEEKQLIDLGFDLAAAKYPSAAPAIQAAKALVDAAIANV